LLFANVDGRTGTTGVETVPVCRRSVGAAVAGLVEVFTAELVCKRAVGFSVTFCHSLEAEYTADFSRRPDDWAKALVTRSVMKAIMK